MAKSVGCLYPCTATYITEVGCRRGSALDIRQYRQLWCTRTRESILPWYKQLLAAFAFVRPYV